MTMKDLFYGNHVNIPIAGLTVISGLLLNSLFRERKYEKLFRNCGLENKDGEIPIVIKEEIKDGIKTLVLHLPEGLCQSDFEKKKEQLEQAMNCKIELGFNKNLIIKAIPMTLSNRYDYIFIEQEKPLAVYCGECHDGEFILDIEKCPHVIVAGETGSGKSSLLRNIVISLILNSYNIELHLVDFQAVELGIFENCRKVKSYCEKPEEFEQLLGELEKENERRLKLFRSVKDRAYINSLSAWNKRYPKRALPYKIVVIDEFARLAEKEYEELMERFRTRVSMDRKVGIHYIVSMQRPDVKCISGSIKANMPTRIAFKTVSQVDSEVILDHKGAEDLKHAGRFLVKYCGEIKEVQALFIESNKVMKLLKQYKAYKTPEEIKAEKQEEIKKLRERCINPYLKKVME
ncbi:MAG TPA: FtsK/SpoIIIE domain-containing protein [Cytophagaceae bacterium]